MRVCLGPMISRPLLLYSEFASSYADTFAVKLDTAVGVNLLNALSTAMESAFEAFPERLGTSTIDTR